MNTGLKGSFPTSGDEKQYCVGEGHASSALQLNDPCGEHRIPKIIIGGLEKNDPCAKRTLGNGLFFKGGVYV